LRDIEPRVKNSQFLRFLPDSLTIFQEDEEDRSGALVNLVNAATVGDPQVVSVMMQLYGMQLPGGMEWDEFERLLEEAKQRQPQQTVESTDGQVSSGGGPIRPVSGTVPDSENVRALVDDLDKWERKAIKRLDGNPTARCKFVSDYIPADVAEMIEDLLEEAATPEAVRLIFRGEAA